MNDITDRLEKIENGKPIKLIYERISLWNGLIHIGTFNSRSKIVLMLLVLTGASIGFLACSVRAILISDSGAVILDLFGLLLSAISLGRALSVETALPLVDAERGMLIAPIGRGHGSTLPISEISLIVQMLEAFYSPKGGGGYYRAYAVMKDGRMRLLVWNYEMSEAIRVLAVLCGKPLYALSSSIAVYPGEEYVGGLHYYILNGFPTDNKRMFSDAMSGKGTLNLEKLHNEASLLYDPAKN